MSSPGYVPWNKGKRMSEESRKKMSDARMGVEPWNKGKHGAQLAWNKGIPHTAAARKKMSESRKGCAGWNKGKQASPELKKKLSDAHIGQPAWNKGKTMSAESCRKMSEKKKGKAPWNKGKKCAPAWNKGIPWTEEVRKKLMSADRTKTSGVNHYNWQGGKSFEEYSPEWTKSLRIFIRERDIYTCQLCGEKQGDKVHSVHHIDYNKKNCKENNLVTLCHVCHVKTNYKRPYWQSLLTNFMTYHLSESGGDNGSH